MLSKIGLDSESGHILVTMAVFATGIYMLIVWKVDYGKEVSAAAEKLSIGNLKRTLVDYGLLTDWHDPAAAEGPILLRHAVQVKNIWIPYGD